MSGSHHPLLLVPGGKRQCGDRPGAARKELSTIKSNCFQKIYIKLSRKNWMWIQKVLCVSAQELQELWKEMWKVIVPVVDWHLRDPTAWLGAPDQEEKLSSKVGLEPRQEGSGRAKQRDRDSPTLLLITSKGTVRQPEGGFYSQEKSKTFLNYGSCQLCSIHSAKRTAALSI